MGMGHLVRTTEIIRSLVNDFQVCLIDGGQIIQNFEIPSSVEVQRLPALKIKNNRLEVVNSSLSLEEVKDLRRKQLLKIFNEFQPDCLITEGFPFSKRKLRHELMPLLEQIKLASQQTKIVCCVRDIVLTKKYRDLTKVENGICQQINQYFDLVLVHSDPKIHTLDEDFSRFQDLTCQVQYTGYVVQSPPENLPITPEDIVSLNSKKPMILVSIGGGRFGHELIEKILEASPILEKLLPHKIEIFTGPFMSEEKFLELQKASVDKNNTNLRKYTPHLLKYMKKADLSISLGGYNTTMNVLATGVNAMIFPSNDGNEQKIRTQKLEKLALVEMIRSHDLHPENLARKISTNLNKNFGAKNCQSLEMEGTKKTAKFLKDLLTVEMTAASLS